MLIYFLILTDVVFFQIASENVQSVNVVRHLWSCKTIQKDRVELEKFLNLQRPKFVNRNGVKMVEVWNVKWKSANYRLETCNDEVGVIKQNGGQYKEDQNWFWKQYM